MAVSSDHELAPAQIEKAEFPTAFRGYDQDAVRRYLGRLASALEHQQKFAALGDIDATIATQDRVEELEDQVGTLESEVARLTREVETEREAVASARAGRVGSGPDPTPLEELDEARIIELLGRETARVLESARSAAADIVKRAETKAVDIEREAQDALIASRREARALVAEKKNEADKLVAKVANDAELKARKLTEEADQHREMVMAESTRILSEAETAADTTGTEARERAAQIVADAESLRRQVLSELVIERSRMRTELDAVTATRDRLVLALSVARGELDGQLEELQQPAADVSTSTVDESEAASEVDALIAELESKRVASRSNGGAGTGSSSTGSKSGSRRSRDRRSSRDGDHADAPDADAHDADAAGTAGTGDAKGASSTVNGARPAKPTDDAESATVDAASTEAPTADPGPDTAPDDATGDDRDRTVVVDEDDGIDTLEFPDRVAELERNGLIDGFHTIDLTDDDGDDQVTDTDDGPGDYDDHVVTTVAARVTSTITDRTRGDLLLEEPFQGRLPAQFKARDVALTKFGPNFRRHLRRALNDDQSDVLDRLRAGRGAIKTAELPSVDDQRARFVEPLRTGLNELAQAGLRAGGGRRLSSRAVDSLVEQLAAYIVEKVRTPTIEAIETTDDPDRERILEPIRAQYRDFRNASLTDLADDALYEAFAIGLFQSIDDRAAIRWLVDPRSDPDPICEINAARDDLRKGQEFPSGHARPLALSNCRCLVVTVP